MVDVVEIDIARLQTVADGMGRESRIVLSAGESLFLSRRDDVAILDEGSRSVVVEGGDARAVAWNLVALAAQNTV